MQGTTESIPENAVWIADSGVFIACGRQQRNKYTALERFAQRNEITFVIPQRVYEELGGAPDRSTPGQTPINSAIETGWVTVADELDYTNPTVSSVMDGVRGFIARESNRSEDNIEKADTALGGVAAHLLETVSYPQILSPWFVEIETKMRSGSRSRRTDPDGAELCQTDVSGRVRKEFQSAEFGDERLTDRLMQIGDRLGRAPAESIPNACEDWASTKATYRFCDNERVDPDEILSAHKREQRSRVRDKKKLLVVSDTTELVFPRHPSKEGLGDIGNSTTDLEGVKVHSTIGVDPQTHRMTGVIDQQSLIEDQQASTKHDANGKGEPIELESEQKKWIRGDRQASDWLAEEIHPIFVHDRGADAFAFYREVTDELDAGFIVRANQNRCIQTPSGTDGRLMDWSEELPEQGRTSVEIQQGSGRKAREAELAVKAGTCELLPPKNDPTHTSPVEVNVVRIDEHGGEDDPIQWVLLTTESVDGFSDSLTVVDSYRARWTIEDWHKVLKTGCRIEERRLETWERMEVLLSVYSVIAWKVLELRELARGESYYSSDVLLTETERSILETKFPELTDNGAQAYAIAVAKIGGYLDRSSDPPPGWETMWKGLKKLQTWAEGYELRS